MNVRELIAQYRAYTVVAVAAAVLLLVLATLTWLALAPAHRSASAVTVSIPTGTGTRTIGRMLQEAGVVRWGWVFAEYAVLTGQGSRLQAGTYLLCGCDSVPATLRAIASGAALSNDVQVTIPEGSNIWQIDKILSTAGLTQPGRFARAAVNDEGLLFPDTYRFAKDATIATIIAKMKAEFTRRADGITPSQVAVASILEKEAKTPEDMAIISGIIAHRIALGMSLQIDATVAYGWCLARWLPSSSLALCDTTQAPLAIEVKVDGPFNTYTRAGLPPGPIANPGAAALQAAEHPQDSPYLFYLSTRDGSKIIYAKTAAEHLANRQKYLGF